MANPSLDAGKRLKGSSVCAPNLKITLTAAARELVLQVSAVWVPVVSPLNLGLAPPRSHKLFSKRASTAVVVNFLPLTRNTRCCSCAKRHVRSRSQKGRLGSQLTSLCSGSWTAISCIIWPQRVSLASPCCRGRFVTNRVYCISAI